MSGHDGWGQAMPVLRVRSVQASLEHYVTALGFEVRWETPGFAAVRRGHCTLFLCEGDQSPAGAWVWIGVEDVEAVCAELRRRGATLRHAPTNYDWAFEMQVADLDGNVLRIASDARPDQPVGEWLDAEGRRWERTPAGGWQPVAGD